MSSLKSKTVESLENWSHLRLRLFCEGIGVGIAAGGLVIIYRIMLELAEEKRLAVYEAIQGRWGWTLFYFAVLLVVALFLGVMISRDPLVGGSGIPQVKGQLSGGLMVSWLRVILLKFTGGVLAIGAGLSLGREGPSVQLGSAAGHGLGRLFGRSRVENKYLITCGASAGLAAAFNAPLAGVIFALEELHKNFSPMVLSSALASSLTADFLSQRFFGQKPVFEFPVLPVFPLNSYLSLILLGAVMGVLGVFFNHMLLRTQDLYVKAGIPVLFRPLIPFVLAGILGFVLPEVLGGGHRLVIMINTQHLMVRTVILLLAVKFAFTMVSYGSGVPGGIFLPLLVIGALSGNLFAALMTEVFHFNPMYANNFVILAMAAYFAAIVKAPITGTILITEMTGSFAHLLPVAITATSAYLAADLLKSRPIYDVLLERLLGGRKEQNTALNRQGQKVLLEIGVCLGSNLDQKKISECVWPRECLLVGLIRGEKEFIPKGSTRIRAGDYLVVLTDGDAETEVRQYLLEQGGACES